MAEELAPGVVVADRYEIESRLGSGGMGVVWAVRDRESGERVALKVLRGSLLGRPRLRRRLLHEARAQTAIDHPDIVQVLDVLEIAVADGLGFEDRVPALVLELLEGETLAEVLERQGPLSVSETARIVLPALHAIAAAHERGIVHRDLKPANLFVATQPNGTSTTKVLDFGIAKLTHTLVTDGMERTGPGGFLGTLEYMAPEQLESASDVDARADLWSIGIIVFECLSGVLPITGNDRAELAEAVRSTAIIPLAMLTHGLPLALTDLVSRLLVRDREKRPSSARPLIDVLERLRSQG